VYFTGMLQPENYSNAEISLINFSHFWRCLKVLNKFKLKKKMKTMMEVRKQLVID